MKLNDLAAFWEEQANKKGARAGWKGAMRACAAQLKAAMAEHSPSDSPERVSFPLPGTPNLEVQMMSVLGEVDAYYAKRGLSVNERARAAEWFGHYTAEAEVKDND